jgi:hypothetical protein
MEKGNEQKKGLDARQARLLAELVRNPDVQAAARTAGVGRTTVYRWLKDPAFAGELARLRNEVMDEALGSVKSLTTRAAEELHRLLGTDNERLRRLVCKDILSYSIRVREVEGLERRLACLEEKINQQMKGKLR